MARRSWEISSEARPSRRGRDLADRSGDAATISWNLGALATAVRTRGRDPEALELTDRAEPRLTCWLIQVGQGA